MPLSKAAQGAQRQFERQVKAIPGITPELITTLIKIAEETIVEFLSQSGMTEAEAEQRRDEISSSEQSFIADEITRINS